MNICATTRLMLEVHKAGFRREDHKIIMNICALFVPRGVPTILHVPFIGLFSEVS